MVEQQQLFLREGIIMEEHDDDDLELSLGLSLRPRRTESAPEMTLKRKVSDVLNEEEFSGPRRKANVGGLRLYEGQDGKYVGKEHGVGGVDCGNRSSVSSGSSSGGSDSYHRNSNAGGNSSDTSSASHSSHPRPNVPTTSPSLSPLLSSKEDTPLPSSNHKPCSIKFTSTNVISKPSPKEPKVVTGKPPKPTRQMSQQSVLLPQMPCVSTTGKGPNGKTISGFLYKYSKTEVSIVCVCHGASFSPAGFVEHAGGEHVEHPLKHIRVVPFALGS